VDVQLAARGPCLPSVIRQLGVAMNAAPSATNIIAARRTIDHCRRGRPGWTINELIWRRIQKEIRDGWTGRRAGHQWVTGGVSSLSSEEQVGRARRTASSEQRRLTVGIVYGTHRKPQSQTQRICTITAAK